MHFSMNHSHTLNTAPSFEGHLGPLPDGHFPNLEILTNSCHKYLLLNKHPNKCLFCSVLFCFTLKNSDRDKVLALWALCVGSFHLQVVI